ncbi:ABC transporter ATP-binding protein [Paenibacillus flagellatus]|uniref:ABC transporter ATP-binding protein n=1 Tax=Paenibacillus flagellatus TaxID=2211139 RepID=A0A2V5KE80_9BACL|nr:ABC transporter ATP-binding protein [Paenibacillus flagellatus]PYI57362.1 ABC transporter ATP-binding protein [Paenibacillus flagellatus]
MRLTIDNVSKTFGSRRALIGIDSEMTPGVYGILGANGSGKTTLMRILAGVMKPSSGCVRLDGQPIDRLNERYRERIGYLPQHAGLYDGFSAEKFLSYIAALKGLSKAETPRKVDEALELVGLRDYRKQKVGSFSGGMKRRVGIAQALLNDPDILIVDEPTAGLDPKERIRFRNLLSRISDDRIVLLSTHIVSDIELIANEIVVLKEGRLLAKETPLQLLRSLERRVWSAVVDEPDMIRLQSGYKVGSIVRVENRFRLRLIGDSKPHEAAVPETPSLEDLYLSIFDEEGDASCGC